MPARLGARTATVSWRAAALYAAMIVAAVAAFLLICRAGAGLPAPSLPAVPDPQASPGGSLARVLAALLVVVLTARAMSVVFRRLGQPPVVGEVIAGILLGPSLLGRLAPAAESFLFPPAVIPLLGLLSQLGVILFMFLVGLQLHTGRLRERTHAAVAISHASIVAPFVLGSALALALYQRQAAGGVPFATFALFMGVAMSITAFPVLARILRDRGIDRTQVGVVAISCAAVDDVTAWCLLALLVGVVRHQPAAVLATAGLSLAYVAVMLAVVRPALRRVALRAEGAEGPPAAIPLILVGLVASALATEAIGIHALFGAFFLGALIPYESRLARSLTHRLEDLVLVLLLPVFFAVTGLRTQLGLLGSAAEWLVFAAILAVACTGKIGGALLAARATGMGWREAGALGVLMNTRGLMELVVLNVGLELGLISASLFAMMVLMAVVTTVATAPLLNAIMGRPLPRRADPG